MFDLGNHFKYVLQSSQDQDAGMVPNVHRWKKINKYDVICV